MSQAFNFYEQLKGELSFNKFEVGDLLFVEYNCPLQSEYVKVWSEHDYIIHVLSGKKTWKTINNSWTAEAGQSLYIKKGANILRQFFAEGFCMLGFFISDDIIKEIVTDIRGSVAIPNINPTTIENVEYLESISSLEIFYQSMLFYFRSSEAPMSHILELKVKELLLTIINSGQNQELVGYFGKVASNEAISLSKVMEENFHVNLKLVEFAALTNKSLSTFKRDFKIHYGTTPGQWLTNKRLERAAVLIKTDKNSISQVAFECGFEDVSHFSRAFKLRFGVSPKDYRK